MTAVPRRLSLPAALALAVAASWLAHAPGLTAPPLDYHYHRQTQTAAIARNLRRDGLNPLTPRIDWDGANDARAANELTLYEWLMALLWPLGGLGDVWGRLLACAFSSLTAVYLLVFLEDRGFSRLEAAAGAVAFSLLPLEVYFGRSVQPEAIALCGTMGALCHWQRSLRRGSWRQAAAAALWTAIAVGHKLPYVYLAAPLAALTWETGGLDAFRRPGPWLAAAAGFGGAAGWYLYVRTGVFVVPTTEAGITRMLEYGRLPYYVFFQAFSRFPELAMTYSGLALGAVGAWQLQRRGQGRFFGAWFASIALSLAAYGGYAWHHEYTMLPLVPIDAAAIGLGAAWLGERARRLAPRPRRWAMAGLALLVAGMPVHAALRIHHWYRLNLPYAGKAAGVARSMSARSDLFVCDERAASALLYVIDRRGWSWSFAENPGTLEKVEALRSKGASFLMAPANDLAALDSGRALLKRYPSAYRDEELVVLALRPREAELSAR